MMGLRLLTHTSVGYYSTLPMVGNPNEINILELVKSVASLSFIVVIPVTLCGFLIHDIPLIFCGASCGLINLLALWALHKESLLASDIMILGYTMVFVLCPLFGAAYSSGLGLFLVILSLVLFFISDPLKKKIYIAIAFIASSAVLIQFKIIYDYTAFHLMVDLVINFGMFMVFYIVTTYYKNIIDEKSEVLRSRDIELNEKNSNLEKYIESNLQLEKFAHLASHELKTPISNITNLSELLSKKLHNKLDGEERELLTIISSSAQNLNDRINSMLYLSRVDADHSKFEKINVKDLVEDLIQKNFEGHHIELNLANKEIYGNPNLIEMLFNNLISNGLIYNKNIKEEKKIIIEQMENTNSWIFSVNDNGIGVDDKYRDMIFAIFKRLHKKEEYVGTGMGLSVCKSIVEKHNGEINMESGDAGGSKVIFTLAKRPS